MQPTRPNPLGATLSNCEVPLFPDTSLDLTNDDIFPEEDASVVFPPGVNYTFNWIQAFFDATSLAVTPQVVVAGGRSFQSTVKFAYSGECRLFYGRYLVSSGVDMKGNAILGLPINPSSPTDSFSGITIYGGTGKNV